MAYSFRLFNEKLTLQDGVNQVAKLGGIDIALKITLNTGSATIAIDFNGALFGLDLKFLVTGPIVVQDSKIHLVGLTQTKIDRAKLTLPDSNNDDIFRPKVRLAANLDAALEIVDSQGLLILWLRNSVPTDLEPDLNWLTGLAYHPDVVAKEIIAVTERADGPFFVQTDKFALGSTSPGQPQPEVGMQQRLNILRIGYANGAYRVELRPTSGALFLHADVFDTSRKQDNQLLFQYALVNGQLQVGGVPGSVTTAWVKDHSIPDPPALLLLRNQDEHGHPLALQLLDREFPLVRRKGQRTVVLGDDTNIDVWETSNEALVIGPRGNVAVPLNLRVRLVQLEPVAIYRAYATTNNPTSVTAPPFIVNGVAKIAQRPPSELHGLSRGAWLRQADIRSATADQATLIVDPVLYNGNPIFHFTELALTHVAGWDLIALREERDLSPDATPGNGEIGSYSMQGGAGTLILPAIDLSFALSNLSGNARRSEDGVRRGRGFLYDKGRERLLCRESQFQSGTSLFRKVEIGDQAHVTGMRVGPSSQSFARMLDIMPVTAATISQVGRIAPELQAPSLSLAARARGGNRAANVLAFGGPPGNTAAIQTLLEPRASIADDIVGKAALPFFEKAWRLLEFDDEIVNLRETFGIPPRQANGLARSKLSDLHRDAIDYLTGSHNTDDIDSDTSGIIAYLNDLTLDEFELEWATPSDPAFNLLWAHVWAPANLELMRRILLSTTPPIVIEKLFNAGASVQDDLKKYLFEEKAAGLITALEQGIDGYWDEAVDLWKTSRDPAIELLRSIYGPQLTRDVFEQLLNVSNDAETFAQAIRDYLEIELDRLAELATDPPEYVVRTRRFKVSRSSGGDEKLTEALWSQCFDLCGFDDKQWLFFLDANSSLIVKLSRKRGLDVILREIVSTYSSPERPDPFGINRSLDAFLGSLDPDLIESDWVGAFLIKPVADISNDLVLSDLAGFDHITGSYVAVGGRQQNPGEPAIDVWAHIFKEKEARNDLAQTDPPMADVKLALTKFDVRVRKTKLSAADIEVQIHPQNVLGRTPDTETEPPTPGAFKFDTIVLRGTLEPPAAAEGGSPDLTYSAFFPIPVKVPIDIAFINRLDLKSLRVARFNNITCIDIDAKMVLQNTPLPIGNDNLEGRELHLESFRIPIPSIRPIKVEIGELRKLAFDLPAASFTLPKARTFNMFGVEVTPTGVGYVRGDDEPFKRIKRDYIWLNRLDLGVEPAGFTMPYLTLSVDFGKLPKLGGDVCGLKFDAILAFRVINGNEADKPYFGISGLDARDIKIDLFRILSIEADRFAISRAELHNINKPQQNAGAILAQGLKLKIFNWTPAPEDARFDLLFLHPTEDEEHNSRKGMLAFYDKVADDEEKALLARSSGGGKGIPTKQPDPAAASGDFFKINWILLAHNMELPTNVLNWLIADDPGSADPERMLESLLEKPQDPGDPSAVLKLNGVRLLEEESWLFGISFKLDPLFTRCNLILHDQHYYAIKLYAEWVMAVFQQKSIELAYLPGATADQDRFRTNLRIPVLDLLGFLKSGETALEWGVNWDFLIDVGFPWKTPNGYDWFRSFSIPVGAYEGKVGFYVEKRTVATQSGDLLTLSAGFGFYLGYYFGAGNSVAWVRAGIGVFAILQGSMTFRVPQGSGVLLVKSSLVRAEITGIVGVFAYGEGGVDVWILSARFRVSAQASLSCTICYVVGAPCMLTYSADLTASYSASCRVGSGWCSWTFHVNGQVGMSVAGQLLLS